MGRFYVPKGCITGDTIELRGSEAHHILKVMRLKRLDAIVVFDGTGTEYLGFIKEIREGALSIAITKKREGLPADDIDITLIQAIPKKDKMDDIVEKATELGARSIIPVFTERTIPDWDGAKKTGRVERWRKIAREASKQCGRSRIPEVARVTEFRDAIKTVRDRGLKLIAALNEEAVPLRDILADFVARPAKNIAIAIGPEGDFTGDEVAQAKDAGFEVIGLGPRVLRCDTAAIAVLSIVNYSAAQS